MVHEICFDSVVKLKNLMIAAFEMSIKPSKPHNALGIITRNGSDGITLYILAENLNTVRN